MSKKVAAVMNAKNGTEISRQNTEGEKGAVSNARKLQTSPVSAGPPRPQVTMCFLCAVNAKTEAVKSSNPEAPRGVAPAITWGPISPGNVVPLCANCLPIQTSILAVGG